MEQLKVDLTTAIQYLPIGLSENKQVAYTEFYNMINDVIANIDIDSSCCDNAIITIKEHFMPTLGNHYAMFVLHDVIILLSDYIEERDANIPFK